MTDWAADSVTKRKVTELIPYERNPRIHPQSQIDQLAQSIREWGWTMPILIDEGGNVIAGHGRLFAAKQMEIEEVPCVTASGWSDQKKKAYIIADNKLSENGRWDFDLLSLEIEQLKDLDFGVALLGFSEVELDGISSEEMDMSVLDELDDEEVDGFGGDVKRAIQIEFESEHYDEAKELIKFWRENEAYIGYMLMQHLRAEKQKL